MVDESSSFFTLHGKWMTISQEKKTTLFPFKNHDTFSTLVEILCRKNNHHTILQTTYSSTLHAYIVEAFLDYLAQGPLPAHLRHMKLVYLDIPNGIFTKSEQEKIATDFQDLCDYLDASEHYLLILLPQFHLLSRHYPHIDNGFIQQQFVKLLTHQKCRFFIVTQCNPIKQYNDLEHYFTLLTMPELSEADKLSLLKQQRTELENYHHLTIPDDLLVYAYSLIDYYFAAHTLEKTLALLDHSAAKASIVERSNNDNQATLSRSDILQVLANWINIPASHLTLGRFKLNEFLQGLQQKILGQDAAVNIISHALLQAHTHLQPSHSCNSLLFVGPAHSGKSTAAIALTEQMFTQLTPLYIAKPSPLNSLIELKLQRFTDKKYIPLRDVIQQTPYAIILFENIEQFSAQILADLHEMLNTTYLSDKNTAYSFSRALIIFSTTLATKRLMEINHFFSDQEDDAHNVDLLQLITHEKKQITMPHQTHSPQELANEVKMEINELPIAFLANYAKIVPFLPLQKITIEKIIRAELKKLGNTLTLRYNVEFAYAPEVVRYLVNVMLRKQEMIRHTTDIQLILNPLYFTVEQALLAQADNQHSDDPYQLFLQLNETGQLLRCDWIMVPRRHHAT